LAAKQSRGSAKNLIIAKQFAAGAPPALDVDVCRMWMWLAEALGMYLGPWAEDAR